MTSLVNLRSNSIERVEEVFGGPFSSVNIEMKKVVEVKQLFHDGDLEIESIGESMKSIGELLYYITINDNDNNDNNKSNIFWFYLWFYNLSPIDTYHLNVHEKRKSEESGLKDFIVHCEKFLIKNFLYTEFLLELFYDRSV